jgi:exonuclease VII large subunit
MHTRVANAGRTLLAQRRGRLDACVQAVIACDPRQVLKRGYSLTRDARTRRLIRSVTEIRDRLRIVTELADGEFRSTAEDPRQPNLFDPPPPGSA